MKSVVFTMTDGTTQTAPVANNTWKSPLEAAKVSFWLAGRSQSIDLMPRSSIPEGSYVSPEGVVIIGGPIDGFGE